MNLSLLSIDVISKLKQALINRGCNNTQFDAILKHYLNATDTALNPIPWRCRILQELVFHNYKTDEKILKTIRKNMPCDEPTHRMEIIVTYKNNITMQLVKKN